MKGLKESDGKQQYSKVWKLLFSRRCFIKKRHPQFNEPQVYHSSVFQMVWKGIQFLFLHFMDFWGKNDYVRKRVYIFKFMKLMYKSNELS